MIVISHENIISHEKQLDIPVGEPSLDKGRMSTAANVFSSLRACWTLKWTPPELLEDCGFLLPRRLPEASHPRSLASSLQG